MVVVWGFFCFILLLLLYDVTLVGAKPSFPLFKNDILESGWLVSSICLSFGFALEFLLIA